MSYSLGRMGYGFAKSGKGTGNSLFPPAYRGPGDMVPGASAWWGFRAYNASYAAGGNPAFDVIRASDSASTTINFLSNGSFDLDSLVTFLTATTGKITKFYDHTGNGRHWTQSNDAKRAAVTLTTGNVSIFHFGGAAEYSQSGFGSTPLTIVGITQVTGGGGTTRAIVMLNPVTGGEYYYSAVNDMRMAGPSGSFWVAATVTNWQCGYVIMNGASSSIQVDGGSPTSGNIGAVTVGATMHYGSESAASFLNGNTWELGIYPSSLSAGNIASLRRANTLFSFHEGDSIAAGANTSSIGYPNRLLEALPGTMTFTNNAVSGSAVSDMVSRAAALDANLPAPTGITPVLSVNSGHNDYNNGLTVNAFLAAMASYLDARRAAGWKVILCTVTPSSTAAFDPWRNAANSTMRTWVGSHADAVCDFAADPTMGPISATADTSLYSDGNHPTLLGQLKLSRLLLPYVNDLSR